MNTGRRRFLVPEVVQTSNMDCGPATLKALLEGFGIRANYGRLREACQTDVDGTSIDTIEEVANQLGLEAEQIMLPRDHVYLEAARALPAVAVIVQPNGNTHFVVGAPGAPAPLVTRSTRNSTAPFVCASSLKSNVPWSSAAPSLISAMCASFRSNSPHLKMP